MPAQNRPRITAISIILTSLAATAATWIHLRKHRDHASSALTSLPSMVRSRIKDCYRITRMPAGNAWEALKSLIVAKAFLERQIEELQAPASTACSRGRSEGPPSRQDWRAPG